MGGVSSNEEAVYKNFSMCCSSLGFEGRSRSRARSRDRSRAQSGSRSPSPQVTAVDMSSTVHHHRHGLRIWLRILTRGQIPDAFPSWTAKELSALTEAVNSFMATLQPFQVPVIMETMPEKSKIQDFLNLFDVDGDSCSEDFYFGSDGDSDSDHDSDIDSEDEMVYDLGRHFNLVKLYGFLKNAGIYSLGLKTTRKILRTLFFSLVLAGLIRQSITFDLPALHDYVENHSHFIRQLEIARTDSWLEVANRMLPPEGR